METKGGDLVRIGVWVMRRKEEKGVVSSRVWVSFEVCSGYLKCVGYLSFPCGLVVERSR